jgi:hypothetical protein
MGYAGSSLSMQKSFLRSTRNELALQAAHPGDHSVDISKNIFL